MYNLEWFKLAQCTREEKKQTVALSRLILTLSEKTRREGVLSLEDDIEKLNGIFAGVLLKLVVDSTDPQSLKTYGETLIAASGFCGRELLDAMVSLEGALSIQKGDNPHMLCRMLSAFLGKDSDLLVYKDPLSTMHDADDHEIVNVASIRNVDYESIINDIVARMRLTQQQVASLRKIDLSLNPFGTIDSDTLAIILLYLDENAQKAVLETVPLKKRVATIRSICDLSDFNTDFYINAAKSGLEKINEFMQANYKPAGGIPAAAAILKGAGSIAERQIFEELEKEIPELAGELRKRMFVFEDILKLDDRSIQKIIREVDSLDLARALKAVSPEMADKIFKNVSSHAAQAIKDDIEYMGAIRIKDVKEARGKIAVIIQHLEETGEIISSRHRDELVIDDFDIEADFS